MGKIALIFPGQGSQSVGMGKSLYDNFSPAKDIFNKVDEILDKNISTICFEGPEDVLKQTINTQPAILATSIAAYEALKSKGNLTFDYTCGHSLGEYAALYAAGVLSLDSAMKLISKRAEAMNTAATSTVGKMAAVLGSNEETIEKCLKTAQEKGAVSVANYNSPDQIVITGEAEAIDYAIELLKESGAKRVIELAVSGAFHSDLMTQAAEEFKKYLDGFTLNNAKIPVLTNVDAELTTDAEEFKSKMPKQIYSSVRWTQTIEKLVEQGVDTFIEVGPGKVLAGLNRKINSTITTYNVFDQDSLEKTLESLLAKV